MDIHYKDKGKPTFQACNGVGYIEDTNKQDSSKVQPFSELDWCLLAGAEPFADGSDPLVNYKLLITDWPEEKAYKELECSTKPFEVCLCVDRTGLGLLGLDFFMNLVIQDNKVAAVALANLLLEKERTMEELKSLGFEVW